MDADAYSHGVRQNTGSRRHAARFGPVLSRSEAEILNSLYVLCLTREDAMRNVGEEKQAFPDPGRILQNLEGREQREPEKSEGYSFSVWRKCWSQVKELTRKIFMTAIPAGAAAFL